MESGVHLSLHPNCHHQIIYTKFKLQVYYPAPYEREFWHYLNADFNAIKNSITDFSWERVFENLFVDEKVSLFNKAVKNILSNYILHEIITIDDRDSPWFNRKVKSLFHDKNKAWRLYIQSNKNDSFFFEKIQLSDLIKTRKQNYHFRLTEKLRDY